MPAAEKIPQTTPKPVVLCILDGWGLSDVQEGNAPALAHTPNFDRLMQTCPNATLITHGPDVGLPRGQMGNSEVGHTNIGAGRVVAMDLGMIDLAIEDGSFYSNEALGDFIASLQDSGGAAHLLGLVSDGGVHGHLRHMLAAAEKIAGSGVPVRIHAITDGRDVSPKSAFQYLDMLTEALPEGARIATLTGRYFVMDRDERWSRVREAYDVIVNAKGHHAPDARNAISAAYQRGETDEFVVATALGDYSGAQDGDGVLCLNFRADRAREIMSALAEPGFRTFDVTGRPDWAGKLGMVDYSAAHMGYMTAMYPKAEITNTLGAWVAAHGLRQFRLAETEKYPHVTFFLNGGQEAPEDNEDRYMPNSPNVATYDLLPEMSAEDVTIHFLAAIEEGYDLIVTNYANPDMVGHTGDLAAAIAACEAVDHGLGRVIDALAKIGGAMIVTADHGNCETMIDPVSGGPHTAHTLNQVPVILFGGPDEAVLHNGRLADLAPTILNLMRLECPPEMTGRSLIS